MKNDKGEGSGGLKEKRAFKLSSPEKEGWAYQRGGLNRGFTVCCVCGKYPLFRYENSIE